MQFHWNKAKLIREYRERIDLLFSVIERILLPYVIVESVVYNNCALTEMLIETCSTVITLGILYWVFTAKYLNIDNNPAVVPIGIMAGEIDETIQHVLTWTVFMALLVKTMIASGHLFLAPFKLWQLFYGKPQKHQTKHKDKTVSITDLYNN